MNPHLKKLIQESLLHRKLLIIVGVTGVIYSIAYSRLALLLKDLMDNLNKGSVDGVKGVVAIALGLAIISNVSKYFHLYLMNYISELVGQGLRNKLHAKFTRLSLSFHNNYTTGPGGLISRALSDVRTIQDGLRMIADIFLHPLLFLLLMGNLFYLDWRLTLVSFSVIPFIVLFLRKISQGIRKYAPMGFQQLEGLTGIIKETLDGIRIIQSFNLSQIAQKKFESVGHDYTESRRKMHLRTEMVGPLTEFIATVIFMMVLLYITFKVSNGTATTGSFLAYITSILMLNPSLKRAQETYVRIQEVLIAAERVNSLLDADHEVPEPITNVNFPESWNEINFKNVTLKFGEQKVLDNINFRLPKGKTIAFVGESGSGKSSLLNLLLRFYDPTEGSIEIDHTSLLNLNLISLRNNIALVSQDVFLFNDSIKNNIVAGNLSRDSDDIQSISKLANAHDFVMKTPQNYETKVGDRGGLLSGGEKQRISIARALFKDAPVLLLDEATSALDSTNEGEVQKGLETLMKGRTTIIVAHRISTIQNVDRIYVLNKGQIEEEGSHQELIQKQGQYYRFFKHQSNKAEIT